MTTGIRPKWKPEKREKDARAASPEPELVGPLPESPALGPQSAPAAVAEPKDQEVETTLKKSKSSTTSSGGLYENMPGDSKDIMKLKKKLREIQKIEDSIAAGEVVEPNQVEKATKKA